MKTFQKGLTMEDIIKNICDSWDKIKISTLDGVWKKLVPTLIGDFEGFKASVEAVSADVIATGEN